MHRLDTTTLSRAETRLRQIRPDLESVEFQWEIEVIERRWSTVNKLTDPRSMQTIYYKVLKPRNEHGDSSLDTTAARFARSQALTDQLIDSLAGTPISAAPVLAVDAREPAIITLGVSGDEMRPAAFAGWPLGRKDKHEVARLTGFACAHIERVGDSETALVSVPDVLAVADHRLEQSDDDAVPAIRETIRRVERMASELVSSGDSVFGHGDMSPTNLLVHSAGVNLIDFTWRTRLRGYDLGVFSFRLFASSLVSKRAMQSIDAALLDGYVGASGDQLSPRSMDVVELLLLMRGLANKSRRVRGRSLAALEVVLDSPPGRWTNPGNQPRGWIWSTLR